MKDESSSEIEYKGIRSFKSIVESYVKTSQKTDISLIETRLYRKTSKRYQSEYVNTPEKAALLGKSLFPTYYDREYLYAVAFSAKMEPLGVTLVSVGGMTSTIADPGRIFSFAILSAANSIVLFHNHVSGVPNPSREDEAVTKRIKECGSLLGIHLSDHIIIGSEGYYSMNEGGYL